MQNRRPSGRRGRPRRRHAAGHRTPAAACGGLVGENGSIQLVRTTTLAAWHDGIEHYVTSFEFTGNGESVGSIVPLPGVPTDVVAAGEWTLQRLQLEVHRPPDASPRTPPAPRRADAGVEIILETQSTPSTSPSCGAVATRSASGRSTTASS